MLWYSAISDDCEFEIEIVVLRILEALVSVSPHVLQNHSLLFQETILKTF